MNERDKMLAGLPYNPADPDLRWARTQARLSTEEFNRTSITDLERRTEILQELFGTCGPSPYIEPSFHCDYGKNIHVGANFYANFDCVILDVAEVRIGDNCLLGPQVGIYTATHPLDAQERISGLELGKAVSIGHNCWIGGHAVINPGVSLGNNVVVASGAVVTRSFEDNVVVGGNPARVLKKL